MAQSTQVPQISCCQCSAPMQTYMQIGADENEFAYFITCLNKSCEMVGFTFSADHYPPHNLEAYLINPIESKDVLQVYLGLVRQESAQAALAIEQIESLVGAAAALRAALAITIFRMEVKQNHWQPEMAVYTYLIKDYPEALPLLESAMEWCLQNWGIRNFQNIHLSIPPPSDTGTNVFITASPADWHE